MKLLVGFDAETATGIALLNALVREISGPEQQLSTAGGGWLEIHLARLGIRLRARLSRTQTGPSPRITPPVEERQGPEWRAAGWERLADLVAGELELATGHANPEFVPQVRAGHAALCEILANRAHAPAEISYLESEQALVAGHRFHPAPKARQGEASEWLGYAPEVRARFPLRWLAVREELTAEEGDASALDHIAPAMPPGFRPLPVHPWQYGLIRSRLEPALTTGAVRDLGTAGPEVVATSSVRTVYVPGHDFFCKFSLDVRITNCVRKNSWYELAGSVALTRLLRPVFAELGPVFDGCVLLAEPGYRTAALADRRLYEGLGVIVREGVGSCAGTPVLAGALADPYGCSAMAIPRLLGSAPREQVLAWWDAYVRLVVPPVLHAYLHHGIVLEPHLQNVLIALDPAAFPVQAVFRDLEGAKLLRDRWRDDPHLHESTFYDAERGWNRVVYCLFVNHLAEIAAALADLHPDLEPELWTMARSHVAGYARTHLPGGSARLRALLAGVPLPAKANLRARWSRAADRTATYVAVRNPFRECR